MQRCVPNACVRRRRLVLDRPRHLLADAVPVAARHVRPQVARDAVHRRAARVERRQDELRALDAALLHVLQRHGPLRRLHGDADEGEGDGDGALPPRAGGDGRAHDWRHRRGPRPCQVAAQVQHPAAGGRHLAERRGDWPPGARTPAWPYRRRSTSPLVPALTSDLSPSLGWRPLF
eukprot:7323802-Prymnesium_polylepis.1